MTLRCIQMDILAWMDCVRSNAGNISYIVIFSSSNLQKYWYFLTFYSVYQIKESKIHLELSAILMNSWTTPRDQNRHGFCYSLFLDSRCRCQIFYYNLKIPYTWLELFLCCYKCFIKTNQQPIKDKYLHIYNKFDIDL